jgi:hypothetical protein
MYRNNYPWVQTVLLFSPTSSFNLYAADFIHGLLKKNEKKVSRSFNFTFNLGPESVYKWNISVVICDTDVP